MIIVGETCEECRLSITGQCIKHAPQVTSTPVQTTIPWPPTFTLTPFPLIPQGWQCPCCLHVFAPHVSMCTLCPVPVNVYITTTYGATS